MPKKKSEAAKSPQARRRRRAPIDVEVEVKVPFYDPETLTESGLAVELVEPRHFEDNWVYKLPDGKLRKGQYLRVRYAGNSDGAGRRHEGLLTYKGKSRRESVDSKVKNKGKKVREEIETTISHPPKVVKIFKRLGLRRSFRYQKYRTIYRVTLDEERSLLAMYDETPLGNYLELEGDSEAIELVAKHLGFFPEDFIAESYVELQHMRCASRGEPLKDLIFDQLKKPKAKPKKAKAKPAKAPKAKASRAMAAKAVKPAVEKRKVDKEKPARLEKAKSARKTVKQGVQKPAKKTLPRTRIPESETPEQPS